jgi:FKBP-type peptidyl-prolyl cis-trans isomerase FklB
MQKSLMVAVQLLAAGMMLGNAAAQQNPAPNPSSPTASSVPKSSATAAKKSSAATPRTTPPLVLKTDKEKASYGLGMKIGGDLRKQGAAESLDPAITARGLRDAMSGGKTALTEEEGRAALTKLQTEVRQKMEAKAHQQGEANRQTGEAFLAANKTEDGVVTLPSGLQYKVLTEGKGPKPTVTDTVTCNYRGTLLNGKEFDSSYKRGEPASFPVNGVIKGWTEALQLMPVGSKWQLFIPPDLAYGDRGAGGDIGPDETLVFEVELLSIGEQKK